MTKKYFFDFVGVNIPISSLTLRRREDSIAFCSVTVPNAEEFAELFNSNPTGTMVLSQDLDGTTSTVGTYILNQILPTISPSNETTVLNGEADFGTDQPSTGLILTIDNPITKSSNSNGLRQFSAAENALIIVGDIIELTGESISVKSISLFVNVVNSRMDITYI